MRATGAWLLVFLMTAGALAGCLGDGSPDDGADDTERVSGTPLTTLAERQFLPFDTTGEYSFTLEKGPFDILEVLDEYVDVELPPEEGLAAAAGVAQVHMGVWLPSNVEDGAKVPVIADIGPYYDDGDGPATEPARRLGGFLIENFVPHGYAVAQVSVFGSGNSNHCMDLMGRSEQLGIDAAVTWLGSQEWSNGNVGLIGRSYDGSTPWEAATFGNLALKTIVPISGLIGMHELMWRNGSAENRAPNMHNLVYGTFGIDGDAADAHTACKDYLLGPAVGYGAYATGDHFLPEVNDYWAERHFLPRALQNYKGSVYLIHGLQDWNVDPHMAFPTHRLIEQKGLDIKGLYGQWAHMYPDRPSEHDGLSSGRGAEAFPESVRYDWAQDLLEWFDHYLKGVGVKPLLHAEVQDNHGQWRVEPTYPPRDTTWRELALGGDLELIFVGSNQAGEPLVVPGAGPLVFQTSGGLAEETRIAGLAQFHVQVTPFGPGGQLFVRLDQVNETGSLRLGHAIMDLRFADGGTRMDPVTPGETITAMMEFQAFDVVVPAGATLRLTVQGTGEGYRPAAVSDPVRVELGPDSVLRLPVVTPQDDAFFVPPAWEPVAEDAEA